MAVEVRATQTVQLAPLRECRLVMEARSRRRRWPNVLPLVERETFGVFLRPLVSRRLVLAGHKSRTARLTHLWVAVAVEEPPLHRRRPALVEMVVAVPVALVRTDLTEQTVLVAAVVVAVAQ